ncbi:hypothetical protein AAZV13_19G146550 [Glycine max]|uniref:uncharacterized protein n=1 Tax=Glycine max TaxID=3847 RepID=UPI001B35726F|nr:uncharacterized protein LOC121174122 [Glycine max]
MMSTLLLVLWKDRVLLEVQILDNLMAIEDPQILVNEVVAIDNATNMSIHSAQLNSVEADAGTSASTAVPEFRQWYSVTSPVCDESTALESPETTLPYMQPSDSNWWPLPQVSSFSTRSLMVLC